MADWYPGAAFVKRCGLIEALAKSCPVERTSPNASPVNDVLTSFGLTVLCDGRRLAHVQRLREDPTLQELFGLEGVVGDDTLRRFMVSVPEEAWQGSRRLGVLQVAEISLKLPDWSRARRVVERG